jgi:glycosyltransferase involved in cell wall biosynthesis
MSNPSQASGVGSHSHVPETNHFPNAINNGARCSISIVMPTYNRAASLADVVRKTHQVSSGFVVEWIIIDDGSSDNTTRVLEELRREIPNLSFQSVVNRGPGQARNLGASLAKHEVVLFMGDDILPSTDDFLRVHAEMHQAFHSRSLAVLGKALWPNSDVLDVGTVMRHIQGHGGEQFGYADFPAYELLDWRFFYTCNISVKRDIVDNWIQEGFSSKFAAASWEDIEFAYRMSKKYNGFQILYAPSSSGYHLHIYNVSAFIRRQFLAGEMAHVFSSMHPELGSAVRVCDVYEAMQLPLGDGQDDLTADYLAAIEGLKSWARILEHERRLGNEAWHDELLFVVFEISYLQGFVTAAARASTNFAKAYARILHKIKPRLGRILESELRADAAFKARLLPLS